jgi:hypothetical protein
MKDFLLFHGKVCFVNASRWTRTLPLLFKYTFIVGLEKGKSKHVAVYCKQKGHSLPVKLWQLSQSKYSFPYQETTGWRILSSLAIKLCFLKLVPVKFVYRTFRYLKTVIHFEKEADLLCFKVEMQDFYEKGEARLRKISVSRGRRETSDSRIQIRYITDGLSRLLKQV